MGLSKMRNIGTEIEKKLHNVGINSAEELKRLGSKQAYFRLKNAFPEVCLVHLFALQGAIDDLDYHQLSENNKKALKSYSDSLNTSTTEK